MTRNRYIVVLHDGEWKIEHGGELSARYRTQEEALLDALNAARRLDRDGQDAEVLTQSAEFGLRMEWTNRLGRLRARVGEGSERQTSVDPNIRRRGLDRVAVALDTRRLVSSEFPRFNKGACVPAPWTGRCSY